MSSVPMDQCLLFKSEGDGPSGILCLQVDDTLFGGDEVFLKNEESAAKTSPRKGITTIGAENTKFNGIDISKLGNCYRVSQERCIDKISKFSSFDVITFEEFQSTEVKYAYAAYSTLPDILVHVSKF